MLRPDPDIAADIVLDGDVIIIIIKTIDLFYTTIIREARQSGSKKI